MIANQWLQIMFFFRNKHIMIDLGTGNNNKITWALTEKQEFIDIVEVSRYLIHCFLRGLLPLGFPYGLDYVASMA
jgi:hypothetical protein